VQSMRDCSGIAAQLIQNQCAIVLDSLQNRCTITVH
jgi:hypothetical protein